MFGSGANGTHAGDKRVACARMRRQSLTNGKQISCAAQHRRERDDYSRAQARTLLQTLNMRGHVRCQPHRVGLVFAPENPKGCVRLRSLCIFRCADGLVATVTLGSRLDREQTFCRFLRRSILRQRHEHEDKATRQSTRLMVEVIFSPQSSTVLRTPTDRSIPARGPRVPI